MPTYHIVVNGEKTEDVSGETYIEAYFNAIKMVPQAYKHDFRLREVLPEGSHTP